MYGRPVVSQEWSVHAQLTISHTQPGEVTGNTMTTAPASATQHDPGGVRMEYSWGGQPTSPPPPPPSSSNIPHRTCYGFQRGNILFTTRPPPREPQSSTHAHQPAPQQGTSNLRDSGYSSEQISPGSYASLPSRRQPQPYGRRCKSTCSIVLSDSENKRFSSASMRPTVKITGAQDENPVVFKCGDPVCYHHQNTSPPVHQHTRPLSSDFAPVQETCEVCGGGRSPTSLRRAAEANTFTTHFCTRVPERGTKESQQPDARPSKDVACQASDQVRSTTNRVSQPKMGNKAYGGIRRKTDSELQLPAINLPQPEVEVKKPYTGKRLSRSPAHRLSRSPAKLSGQSPLAGRKPRSSQTLEPPDAKGQRKPRTVHIDVYCTGSEDADASCSSDDTEEISDSLSSPQTVFESEKLKVVHSRIGKERLPAGYLRRQQQQVRQEKVASIISRRSESFKHEKASIAEEQQQTVRGYDSDDGLSSHYPSQMSSYSTLRGVTESSIPPSEIPTSRDPSWSTISTSSLALTDEYDSALATSWKDTVTDFDSIVQSSLSLAQSDSFEYADAADRLRIREKERAWAEGEEDIGSKTWKSPQVERKHFLQQQKLKEFLEKHLGESPLPIWKPETTEDSDDDETGDAWSFCGRNSANSLRSSGATLKREDTVKRVTSGKDKDDKTQRNSPKVISPSAAFLRPSSRDTGSLSDSGPHRLVRRTNIGPFGSKSPSPPLSKVPSSITQPFTTVPGKRTDQLSKAEKFGSVVGVFRKPGHHVGPSKNPECGCEHCRKYYEGTGQRTRTRSVGDSPFDNTRLNKTHDKNGDCIVQNNSANVSLESDLESSITEDASTDNEKFLRQHMSSLMNSDEDDEDE